MEGKDLINKAPRVPAVTAQQQRDPSLTQEHTPCALGEQCPYPGISSSNFWVGFLVEKNLEQRQLCAFLQAVLPQPKEPVPG